MKASSIYLEALLSFLLLSPAATAPTPEVGSDTINLLEPDTISNSTSVCFHSLRYSVDVSELPLPEWLDDWDSLLPVMSCDDEYFISIPTDMDSNTTAKILAYSLASGFAVDNWSGELQKRDTVFADLDAFWETGVADLDSYQLSTADDDTLESENGELQKRWYFPGTAAWRRSTSNRARVFTLNSISSVLGGCGDEVLELSRSAICATTNGQYGCFSWSGGGHSLKLSLIHI